MLPVTCFAAPSIINLICEFDNFQSEKPCVKKWNIHPLQNCTNVNLLKHKSNFKLNSRKAEIMVRVLSREFSLINQYLSELRDLNSQQDRARFRKNIERIGEVMAYEISKKLETVVKEITTPLGVHHSTVLDSQPVLATVLRAGLIMHQGFLNYFDKADNAFVSAFRKHDDDHSFEVIVEYLTAPDLNGRDLIIIDPMLATGQSMYLSYMALLKHGNPKSVTIASVIASEEGVEYIKNKIPNARIYIADVDPQLDVDKYIVPGLGDAGDLSYGMKQ